MPTSRLDLIGNPLTYDGWTLTLEPGCMGEQLGCMCEQRAKLLASRLKGAASPGRQLEQMTKGTTTLQYKYNDAGLRTQKINGSTTTKYYWAGSNLSHMTSGSDTLHFWYDAAGLPSMVTYNGAKYYYKLNQQGDVIGLLDTTGKQVVALTYDSWGKILTRTGEMAETLGLMNPLRYRGYIYDMETGLYYLQSRYYNPEWGRFTNSDTVLGGSGGLVEHNIFAYCQNNPIDCYDPDGRIFTYATNDAGMTRESPKHPNVIDPFIRDINDFGLDINNFNPYNTSEDDVLSSNFFSAYKGSLVIRHSIPNTTSCAIFGIMFINRSKDWWNKADRKTVQHESGHTVQEKVLGTGTYIACIRYLPVINKNSQKVSITVYRGKEVQIYLEALTEGITKMALTDWQWIILMRQLN